MLLFLWTDQVIDEINSWAKKSTKGLIKICSHETVLKEERKKNSLILANALYFKEAWLKNLMPRRTEHKHFHLLNGQTIQVPFMTSQEPATPSLRRLRWHKILKIPYQNGSRQFAMYFFLPDTFHDLKNLKIGLSPVPDSSISDSSYNMRTRVIFGFRNSSFHLSLKLQKQ